MTTTKKQWTWLSIGGVLFMLFLLMFFPVSCKRKEMVEVLGIRNAEAPSDQAKVQLGPAMIIRRSFP